MTDAQLWGSGWAKGLPDYSLVWATLKLGKAWRVGPFQQLHWLAHVTQDFTGSLRLPSLTSYMSRVDRWAYSGGCSLQCLAPFWRMTRREMLLTVSLTKEDHKLCFSKLRRGGSSRVIFAVLAREAKLIWSLLHF